MTVIRTRGSAHQFAHGGHFLRLLKLSLQDFELLLELFDFGIAA